MVKQHHVTSASQPILLRGSAKCSYLSYYVCLQDIVQCLLDAGANPNLRDNFGGTAMHEAIKARHTGVLDQLSRAGAQLQIQDIQLPSTICSLVKYGDLAALRLYKEAGVDFDLGDYDQRTPLHIAAAEGKLEVVKYLVEEGGASIHLKDRWGATAVDEAVRVGAKDVAEYLKQIIEGAAAHQ
eukprot:GHUV01027986.1.p1 GENE.GHUV01027986.1~~GHUV01027986.1.p1  ORF type:complete len:183 (+),score=45.08 GHUV01027986.1:188-736(+)